jgi:hypothetical protein
MILTWLIISDLSADYDFLRFDQATVAAAIISRARETQGIDLKWSAECCRVTSLDFEEMRECYEQVTARDLEMGKIAEDVGTEMACSPKSVCSMATSFSFTNMGHLVEAP